METNEEAENKKLNKNSRTNLRRNLKDKLLELENDHENLISPRSARSQTEKTTDDEKIQHSARSSQKLITSEDETLKDGKKNKTKKAKSRSRERNIDKTEGKTNQAYESEDNTDKKSKKEENVNDKPPKKTRRARKKTETDDPSIISDSNILAVIVHQTDKLRTDVNIYHPVIRIHILDLDADGQYVRKTKKDRHTLFYYEKENRKLDYVSPIMTTQFDFKKNRTILPRWEEIIVFNEDFTHFTKDHPNVLIMFELLDTNKANNENNQTQTYTSQDTGKDWQRIAWAFLKLVGSDKTLNTEKKIRLQLFYSQSQYKFNLVESLVPEIYTLYKNGPRVKYPASLHVTVKSITPPKSFLPGVGSSDILSQENFDINSNKDLKDIGKSQASLHKLIDVQPEQFNSDETGDPNKKLKNKTVIWSRLAGLPCRVPNALALKLTSSKKGCYSVKFSVCGSYLACGCIEDQNSYPIYIYEIPDGKLSTRFYGHFGLVYEISWSKLDKYIVTASNDATARVFDVENKSKEAYKILPHPGFLYSAKFHPDSLDFVCTSGYDRVVRVWSINNKAKKTQKFGELLQELHGHLGYINSICFSSNGLLLYSADSAGDIKVWNCNLTKDSAFKEWSLNDEIEIKEFKNQSISYIHLLPNQFRMIVQLRDNQLKLIDIRLKSIVQRFKGTYSFSQNLKSTVSPCGNFLFNCGSDTRIYCWDINTGNQLATASINLNYLKPARDIDFHPFDNFISFCSYDTNAPIYVFKFDSERVADNIGYLGSSQTNLNLAETNDMAKTVDISALPNQQEESYKKESALEKKLKEDMTRFNEFQINRWKNVQEKLDSVYPQKGQSSARNVGDYSSWSKPLNSSITISMPDNSKRPEFKYKGPKEAQDLVVALYDYKAQRGDELDFTKGDEILVLVRENENWWLGELIKNKQEGYFPANYVQEKSMVVIKKGPLNQPRLSNKSIITAKDIITADSQNSLNYIKNQPNQPSKNKPAENVSNLNANANEKKTIVRINDKPTKPNEEINLVDLNNETEVNIINEIPTKDESNAIVRKRDQTKRRTFAHVITGSHLTSSDI